MNSNKRLKPFVTAVCALLVALLLFAALLGEIRLNALQSEIEALRREKTALEREKQILSARLAGQMDLEELEQCAEEILGMQRCRADQIVTLPDIG